MKTEEEKKAELLAKIRARKAANKKRKESAKRKKNETSYENSLMVLYKNKTSKELAILMEESEEIIGSDSYSEYSRELELTRKKILKSLYEKAKVEEKQTA